MISLVFCSILALNSSTADEKNVAELSLAEFNRQKIAARFTTKESWENHVKVLLGEKFQLVKAFETDDYFFLVLRDEGAFVICDLPRKATSHRPSFESLINLADGSDPVIGWNEAQRHYDKVKIHDEIKLKNQHGGWVGNNYYHGTLLPVRAGVVTEDVVVHFPTVNLKVELKLK